MYWYNPANLAQWAVTLHDEECYANTTLVPHVPVLSVRCLMLVMNHSFSGATLSRLSSLDSAGIVTAQRR